MKRFVFFVLLGVILGFMPDLCYGQKTIGVTATVLEHITFIKNKDLYQTETNTDLGYWIIKEKGATIIVSRY